MKLVSAEEAERLRILWGHLESVNRLSFTVEALWPIVEGAAKQPCLHATYVGRMEYRDCGECFSCLARELERKANP